jgi:hypothetical protein
MRGSGRMSSRIFLERKKWTIEISGTGATAVFELTRVDNHASDGSAVATDPLGRTVHDDICTVINRTDQVP